jgi:hypothetical protein
MDELSDVAYEWNPSKPFRHSTYIHTYIHTYMCPNKQILALSSAKNLKIHKIFGLTSS